MKVGFLNNRRHRLLYQLVLQATHYPRNQNNRHHLRRCHLYHLNRHLHRPVRVLIYQPQVSHSLRLRQQVAHLYRRLLPIPHNLLQLNQTQLHMLLRNPVMYHTQTIQPVHCKNLHH